MPGTTSKLDSSTAKNYDHMESPQNWPTDTMKSNASQQSGGGASSATESPSTSSRVESRQGEHDQDGSVEVATEAMEKDKDGHSHSTSKRTSWMKNLGSGMRTLRLRKSQEKGSLKGIKMQVMDDAHSHQHKEPNGTANASGSKEDSVDGNSPAVSTPATPVSVSSASVSTHGGATNAGPPNVIPPFENDPHPHTQKEAKESKSSRHSSSTSTTSLKRGWRKLGVGAKGSGSTSTAIVTATANGGPGTSGASTGGSGTGTGTPGTSGEAEAPSKGVSTNPHKPDPSRFIGEGLCFKAKLIGVLEVSGPRGDRICQEALSELKMAVKAAGEHKQKVTVHVALDGLRLRDEKTTDCLYHHQVHKISFIAQDLTDSRAFGYIFGAPDTGHRFFGIKTEKSASGVVMAMRDLFQVVFDLKKKEIERAKQQLEMQQKFLATRAAEGAPKNDSTKSGGSGRIAESYIDGVGQGACALPSPSSSRNQPAEADLLNLEVELSSLQEGLENIHSNLMEARSHAQNAPFNRGSTSSISSDPLNPMGMGNARSSTSSAGGAFKYGYGYGGSMSTSHQTHNSSNRVTSVSSTGGMLDPFGDSFDPFVDGSNKFVIPADPFSNVDPFPLPKPGFGPNDSFGGTDPFNSPPAAPSNFSFSFSSDNQSAPSSRPSTAPSAAPSTCQTNTNSRYAVPPIGESQVQSLNNGRRPRGGPTQEESGTSGEKMHWTASFEDNFVPSSQSQSQGQTNGPSTEFRDTTGRLGDLFTELDPLSTGKGKTFTNRKTFFQDVKDPSQLSRTGGRKWSGAGLPSPPPVTSQPQSSQMQSQQQQPLKVDTSTLPNSFSTNFAPSTSGVSAAFNNTSSIDFDSHFKVPPPPASAASAKNELKTSSIRLPHPNPQLANLGSNASDSPPNYSPPLPPPGSASNSIYFVNPAPTSNRTTANGGINAPPASVKKSPQLLKRMTISTGGTGSKTSISPRGSGRGRQHTLDSSSTDEIPSLTPPPRPPHSGSGGTLRGARTGGSNAAASIATAVPRPHSGSTRSESSRSSVSDNAPEPPPRPLQTTTTPMTTNMSTAALMSGGSMGLGVSGGTSLPLVSPPPLPPKKQAVFNLASWSANPNHTSPRVNLNGKPRLGSRTSDGSSNDLPLPLPSRKNGHSSSANTNAQEMSSIPRYAVPPSFEKEFQPTVPRDAKLFAQSTTSITAKQQQQPPSMPPPLTMEQALSQVATLSLGQLASKLELPVEQLSSLTIQQLAERLTSMDINVNHPHAPPQLSRKVSTTSSGGSGGFETNFFDPADADDFSTVSAPSTMEGGAHRAWKAPPSNAPPSYDKYAVFRELTLEDASGFSVLATMGSGAGAGGKGASGSGSGGSRTLTSRDSSSERTLQADDEPDQAMGLSTMDDVTDVNFSDAEDKSILDDEIVDVDVDVDNYLEASNKMPQWATFESNFGDQCIPLESTFNKSEDSPSWDSDEGAGAGGASNPIHNLASLPSADQRPSRTPKALKTTKIDSPAASQFDFQPFTKPNPRIEDAIDEDQSQQLDPLVVHPSEVFQRQSSGSSRHSGGEKYLERERGSDYSGESAGRPSSGRRPQDSSREVVRERDRPLPRDRHRGADGGGRDSRTSSFSSSGRRYSDEMDEDYHRDRGDRRRRYYDATPTKGYEERRRRRPRYYDDEEGGVENPSFDPTIAADVEGDAEVPPPPPLTRPPREPEFEEDEEDDRSYASTSRHSHNRSYLSPGGGRYHHRRRHVHHRETGAKYHSQSLQRRRPRDDRYSPERYSNHESDFDSYEDDTGASASGGGSRRGRDRRDYYRDRDRDAEYSSRPSSSGSTRRPHPPGYNHYRGRGPYGYREPRHGPRRDRDRDHRRRYDDPEDDPREREVSEYSDEVDVYRRRGHRDRDRRRTPPRGRGHRLRKDRDRDDGERERFSNSASASWESESPPPTSERGHLSQDARGERKRHSAGKGGRPVSGTGTTPLSQAEVPRSNHKMPVTPNTIAPEGMGLERSAPNSRRMSTEAAPMEHQHPQLEFDDNFGASATEEQRSYPKEGEILQGGDRGDGEVFFPSSFDVDMEASHPGPVLGVCAPLAEEDSEEAEAMDVKTPDSDSAYVPAVPDTPKILSMISEESHNSNSNTPAEYEKDMPKSGEAGVEGDEEVEMKKSDSFNIFERERDPFAEDDFFK